MNCEASAMIPHVNTLTGTLGDGANTRGVRLAKMTSVLQKKHGF